MSTKRFCFTKVLFVLAFNFIIISANTQATTCPLNLDFEKGDFTNWQCFMGTVEDVSNTNSLNLFSTAPTPGRHTLIPPGNTQRDFFGNFPIHCPNGSNYSLMLGNPSGGSQAESVSYTFTVPATTGQFTLTYYYAVVMQNPNHQPHQQPRFRARVTDVASGTEINCVSFDFVASGALPGFKRSAISEDVVYKDWVPVIINLGDYAGRSIKLEFITSDCIPGRDFGYAYVDVSSSCGNPVVTASLCGDDNFLTLKGPDGFSGYRWYLNNDFSAPVSSYQNDSINPVPPGATAYSLITIPYPGFGCVDTFTAPVKWVPKPAFRAGDDREIWCNELTQLGMASNAGYAYLWSPADKLTSSVTANPRLKDNIFSPVNFVVQVTDKITGCITNDSVTITPKNCFVFVPTAFTPNGDGLNDVIRPYLGGIRQNGLKRFSIYNRSGNLIFSTAIEGRGWDGTHQGRKMDSGVYVWLLEYISKDGMAMTEKGTVTLIR